MTDTQTLVERVAKALEDYVPDRGRSHRLAALTELAERLETAERERQWLLDREKHHQSAVEAQRDELLEALREISEQQPKTLEMIRSNGFVFDDIGAEPGNWKHLAFTIYTDVCEVDTLARAAIAKVQGGGE